MSDYNLKNYTEQGGEVTHIGGLLLIEEEGSVEGLNTDLPKLPNQDTYTKSNFNLVVVKELFNTLFQNMKDAGLMLLDGFHLIVRSTYLGGNNDIKYNNALVGSVAGGEIDNEIIVKLSRKVEAFRDIDRGDEGIHKWFQLVIEPEVQPPTDLYLNGRRLTEEDLAEANKLVQIYYGRFFCVWVKADCVVEGRDNSFTLWAEGHELTTFTLSIVEPE